MSSLRTTWRSAAVLLSSFSRTKSSGSPCIATTFSMNESDFFSVGDIVRPGILSGGTLLG